MAYADSIRAHYQRELEGIRGAGLFKEERAIHDVQGADIDVEFPAGTAPRRVINLCANNYLGLSGHPDVIAAAHRGLDHRGYGLSSVRFICGTQDVHRRLETKLTTFLGTEDTILFPSCLDANAGVFEALFGEEDVLIADRLVHASIIDGMRLCKARQDTYKHANVDHLRSKLELHADARFKVIVTDGVFSMDGDIAPLAELADLADEHGALLFVDDSHATGFMGRTGRGTHEHCDVVGRVDLLTTTLGKALGGASGGCVSGRAELVEMCRQRARPYLFSNTVAPVIVEGALAVLDLLMGSTERRDKLEASTAYWRAGLSDAGFVLKGETHPIVPVMLFNAKLAQDVSRDLFEEGIFAVGFFFPVVPQGQARIRTQISAAHERHHLDAGLAAFRQVGEKHGILGLTKKEIVAKYGE